MMQKIPRKQCLLQYPKLPWSIPYREKYYYPKVHKQYVLTLPSKSAKGHAKNIADALQVLLKNMGYSKLIFMGDSTIPWLYRQSGYEPANDGINYLVQNKVSKTFNGGLAVDVNELGSFVKQLFWLVRTNTILPQVYGLDEGQHIVVNICKYGNIHFDTLDEEGDEMFDKHLPATGLHLLDAPNCYEPFGKGGQIAGRTITIA